MNLGSLEKVDRFLRKVDRWLPREADEPPEIDHRFDSEWEKCAADAVYFITNYCMIYDAVANNWVPFTLWPSQREVVEKLTKDRLVAILKARQIGITWTVLAYALWLMVFKPAAEIGVFSRRETEAIYLISRERIRGIYIRLPDWMKERSPQISQGRVGYQVKVWRLKNGSVIRAFPTSAGDSYTFTLVIADEFDLAPDQNNLMRATKPTIDNGGQMVLLSRVDKRKPLTEFKRIYEAARKGLNAWTAIFLSWKAHPKRDAKWYEAVKADIVARTGVLDDLYEQYPASDAEALQGRTLDKRIPPQFLAQCFAELAPWPDEFLPAGAPAVPNLEIYALPVVGRSYILTADPAEGNPNSDPSAATVIDSLTREEMATIEGRWEVTTFAAYCDSLGQWYNNADVLPERNNHGHALIAWMVDHSNLTILSGLDEKLGWQTNSQSKARMYSELVAALRDREAILHSFATFTQLSSVEGATLSAPDGEHDDRAVAFALAIVAGEAQARNWLI